MYLILDEYKRENYYIVLLFISRIYCIVVGMNIKNEIPAPFYISASFLRMRRLGSLKDGLKNPKCAHIQYFSCHLG